MKTERRTFTHKDGSTTPYDVKIYATDGKLIMNTIRGDLGHKQATKGDEKRTYAIEQHNAKTWAKMIKDGATTCPPYAPRWPEKDGDTAWLHKQRNVSTPRLQENFMFARFIEKEDDSQTPDPVGFWINDEFFSKYGYAFIESSNSTPDAQKGHPFIVFDRDITDRELYEEMLRAWVHYYGSRADGAITSSNELSFHKGGGGTNHIVGNICPLAVFDDVILKPYRAHVEQVAIEQQEQRKKATV